MLEYRGAAVIIALFAAPANGWVTKSQSVYGAQISEIQDFMSGKNVYRETQAQLGYLWSMPENLYDESGELDDRGLGGGITWAWDPKLCKLLEPRFKEDVLFSNYINCEDFKSAVSRAFDKWSANSRFINFVDVTAECTKLGLDYGPPTDDRRQNERPHGGCALAEIWVTQLDTSSRRRRRLSHELSNATSGLLFEESELNAATAVATATSHAHFTQTFRYTNGERPHYCDCGAYVCDTYPCAEAERDYNREVVETIAGTFSFNTDSNVCWYLDSQWCYKFHRLKQEVGSAADAKLIVVSCTYAAMFVSGLFFVYVLYRITRAAWNAADLDKDGTVSIGERLHAVAKAVAEINPFFLALFLTWFIVPPMIVNHIFAPCFDCYDFESSTLHEIGHFLGLGHPDNIPDNWRGDHPYFQPNPGVNSYQAMLSAGGRTNSSNCKIMWDDVHEGVPIGAEVDMSLNSDYPVRNAQMESTVQHNPKSCLTDDDLEALAVLYPDCGARSLSKAVCHKVNHNIGLVRVMVYVVVPFCIILLVVVILESIMEHYEHQMIEEEKAKTVLTKWKLAGALASKMRSRTDVEASLRRRGWKSPKAGQTRRRSSGVPALVSKVSSMFNRRSGMGSSRNLQATSAEVETISTTSQQDSV